MTGKRESAARELLDKQNMNTLVQKYVYGCQSQETCREQSVRSTNYWANKSN